MLDSNVVISGMRHGLEKRSTFQEKFEREHNKVKSLEEEIARVKVIASKISDFYPLAVRVLVMGPE